MPILETPKSRGVCGHISVGLSSCKKFGSLLEKYRPNRAGTWHRRVNSWVETFVQCWFQLLLHWLMRPRQVKQEMKTKHFCPCEFLSQNKDTHPPFWWRFSTKYQPVLNLQTTLLSSHPPPVTYHAKATALWFWWPFLSTKVMLTLWAVQAGSLCTNAGVEVPRRWCTVTHPHILYSTFSHKSFSCC